MAQYEDFEITGTSIVPYEKPFDDGPAVIEGIKNAVMKSVMKVADLGGTLDQKVLAAKFGEPGGSGIAGRTAEYGYAYSNEQYSGKPSATQTTVFVKFTVRAKVLQKILIEEGILTLPGEEELPEHEPEETPAPETETEKEDTAVPEEEELEPEEPPPEPEPEPSPPAQTHIVSTKDPGKKGSLNIRSGPSLQAKSLGQMPKGTKIRVLEEYEGDGCHWNKYEITDPSAKDASDKKKLINKFTSGQELWSHSYYLKPLPGVPASLPYSCDYKTDSSAFPPRWRDADPHGYSCFYNRKTGEYETVVETKYQSEAQMVADNITFTQLRKDVLAIGVEKLLNYYHKDSSPEMIEKILGAFRGAYIPSGVEGFFLDSRPGSFMKFKVAFSAKYLNAIPTRHADLSKMTVDNADPHLRSYTFSTSTIRDNIEIVANRMEVYAKQIEASGAEVVTLDLKAEAKRLREIPAVFETFLSVNGHMVTKEEEWLVEVGITRGFKIDWVLLSTDKKKAFPLPVSLVHPPVLKSLAANPTGYSAMYPDGFGFKQINPIDSPRTIAYLWYLDKMVKAVKTNTLPVSTATESNKLTWQNFVTSFTYPMPKIFPAEEPGLNCDPPEAESVKSCNTIDDTAKSIAKTASELVRETKCLNNSFDKLLAAEARKDAVEIVGDSIYVEVDHVLVRMGCNIDNIFNEVLNKYGLANLIELILGCLPVDNPIESQLSCLEKSLPGLYEAAYAAQGVASGTGTFEEKKAILDFILEADPKGALDCMKIQLPDFCLPSLPTISFPDGLSLPDPMGFVMPSIEAILEEMLINMFCSITTDLLKGIDCDDVTEAFDAAKGLATDLINDALTALLDKLGLGAARDEAALFVAAVAKGTTGRDMADFLEGNGSNSTKQHAKALLRWNFPGLKDDFGSDRGLDEFFGGLGGILGRGVINSVRTGDALPAGPSISGLLCDNDGKFEASYSGALSDRLSDNRAQEQADGARNRQRDLRKKLDDLADDINSLLPDPLKNLEDFADGGAGPSPFSPGCPNSVIPKIPALDKMTDDVLDAIYTPTRMAFSEDATGFFSTIFTKEVRALEEGDPGYITHDEGSSNYGWTTARVDKENADKTKTVFKIAPYLKRNLQRGKSFWSHAGESRTRIAFKADALEIITLPPPSDEITKKKEEIKKNENILEGLIDALRDGGSKSHYETKIKERKESILELKKNLGELEKAALAESGVSTGSKDKPLSTPPLPKLTTKDPRPIYYDFLYNRGSVSDRFEDRHKVKMLSSEEAKTGVLYPTEYLPLSYPENVPSLSYVAPSDNWPHNDSTPQAEAFASYVLSKFQSAGFEAQPDKLGTPLFLEGLKNTHRHIFVELLRKVAKQVSRSPLFDMEKLDNIVLVRPPIGDDGTVCAPSDLAESDLLAVYEITQEVKKDFEDECEPLGQDQNATSSFEKSSRAGTVKMMVRVYMLETLLKSIFAFSEFKGEKLLSDPMVVEFINYRMKNDLKRFDLEFYKDVALEAKRMIKKRVDANVQVEDLFEVIDMDALLNEKNPIYETGEEALKYLALEQLSDLVSKLEAKIGTKTHNIHKRFTDTPAPGTRSGESTPDGWSMIIPKGKGGWMRTIHAMGAQNSEEHNRFQRLEDSDKKFSLDNLQGAKGTGVGDQKLGLVFPDMDKDGGTFFLEKYVRIEDRDNYPAGVDAALRNLFRKRKGGPESIDSPATSNEPHLSGVVNIQAWKDYIEFVKSLELPAFEDAKITDYFKPWKYGLRLVWAPKLTPGVTHETSRVNWEKVGENEPTSQVVLEDVRISTGFKYWDDQIMWYEWKFGLGNEISAREKTFFATEKFAIETTSKVTTSGEGDAQVTIAQGNVLTAVRRTMIVPLITFESQFANSSGTTYKTIKRADKMHRNSTTPGAPLEKLRKKILASDEYKFLFEYIFPLPRMLSLITIYNGSSLSLTQPEVDTAFDRTKGELRTLFYTLSPNENENWWERRDSDTVDKGGNAGAHQLDSAGMTAKGPSANLAKMAAATVPLLVRGMASFMDPHYALVSRLVDAGWGGGKTWGKVPPLWPVNFFFGWGPPLTPLGMAAYSMPELPGDKKKKKQKENEDKLDKAASSGTLNDVADECED